MLYLPNEDMQINKFEHVELPTKAQIFKRVGMRGVAPSGSYSGDEPVTLHPTTIQSLRNFLDYVESVPNESE